MALFGSKTGKTEDKKVSATAIKKQANVSSGTSMKDLYAETPTTKSVGKSKVASRYTESNRLLIKPLVTEKATNLAAENKYLFVVEKSSNKIEVAKAVKAIYGVEPLCVNIINMKGKRVARGRIRGQRKDWKKAIVTLAKGASISIYEGV